MALGIEVPQSGFIVTVRRYNVFFGFVTYITNILHKTVVFTIVLLTVSFLPIMGSKAGIVLVFTIAAYTGIDCIAFGDAGGGDRLALCKFMGCVVQLFATPATQAVVSGLILEDQ